MEVELQLTGYQSPEELDCLRSLQMVYLGKQLFVSLGGESQWRQRAKMDLLVLVLKLC